MRMNTRIKWRMQYIKLELVEVIFVLSVVLGSCYALMMQQERATLFVLLNDFFRGNTQGKLENIQIVKIVYHYCIQLFMIWLMGLFTLTLPLALFLLGSMIFSYAYTITVLLLGYGGMGLALSIIHFGIQGTLLVGIGIIIGKEAIKNRLQFDKMLVQNYYWLLLPVFLGSCLIAGIEMVKICKFSYIIELLNK
ncbi:hypothetical protein CS063_04030 [Sporanaerobium hydrogeniformans]|uniref:Uncharacterized protein n=1 Tax=Sporanaerobium hydrogeniformans TaxID=3072179 RepID=A0AC61DFR9_9FIRM|nr:hypothetical protein [Sporanaerobium hydrogeniformans]PHV71735.1 hypothetical protein CS063_04030 [Sporanaerobium hydrogeniformans]